jgi:hypothetical protein
MRKELKRNKKKERGRPDGANGRPRAPAVGSKAQTMQMGGKENYKKKEDGRVLQDADGKRS